MGVLVVLLLVFTPLLASAAESSGAEQFQSGYEDISTFGGPESVDNQVRNADVRRDPTFTPEGFERFWDDYFDWKAGLKDRHGFSTGTTLYLLYQRADESLNDDKDGAGAIFRWQGNWELLGRGTSDTGRLQWRLEYRTDIGGQSPSQLGSAIGTAALDSGFAYSPKFDLDFSVLNWTQGLANGRAGVVAGRLDFAAYLDAFVFQTFSRAFLNRAFLVNPTLGVTGVGALGIVAKGLVTDNVWIGGGIYDANAASGEFDLDTIREGEFLSNVEVGWFPSFARRATDRVQFTFWNKDSRDQAGVPSGSGWVVSASWQVTDTLLPFLRFGHSDGGAGVPAEDAVALGLEAKMPRDSALAFGFGWAKPSEKTFGPGLRDEYVVEVSYRLQLFRNLSLMPDIQLLIDPADNPDDDRVWVVGLRAIFTI